jgi:hypothetical protein
MSALDRVELFLQSLMCLGYEIDKTCSICCVRHVSAHLKYPNFNFFLIMYEFKIEGQ